MLIFLVYSVRPVMVRVVAFSSAKIMNKKKFAADPEKQKKMAFEAGLVVDPDENNCKQCHNERSSPL